MTIFSDNPHDRRMERLMMTVPNFAPRGVGFRFTEAQLFITTTAATPTEILTATMRQIRCPPFRKRFNEYIESEEKPMTYINEKHRARFTLAAKNVHRENYALLSALYLLTADQRLWSCCKHHINNGCVFFENIKLNNCTERAYTLYCAAKDLTLGTKHLTVSDLSDADLVPPMLFRTICKPEKTVQKEPGKKPAPSKKPKPQQEVVVQIPLSELHPFPDHPFQVREDASMQETAESVKEYGVLVPALARPREDGGYELIAGHRRKHACELAGLATMPVIVRDIDRDAATIIMVDSNLQRENILPSERAKAYKMKMEAIKRQGARTDLTSPKISAKFRSDDEVGQDAGVSGDTIRNYIALTQLVPELQQMVDEKKIALSPAYQIAALTTKEQGLLLETIDSEQATPSLSQAQRMKKLSQSGELNEDTMLSIMTEQKKPEKNDITLSGEKLRKYFPRSYTPFQIENTIFKLLDAWQKKRQRDQSR